MDSKNVKNILCSIQQSIKVKLLIKLLQMPNWSQILDDVQTFKDQLGRLNILRQQHIVEISQITDRNVIAYNFGWLKAENIPNMIINNQDVNAFMNAIHGLDRSKWLDIFPCW